jgi:hypothetical protein
MMPLQRHCLRRSTACHEQKLNKSLGSIRRLVGDRPISNGNRLTRIDRRQLCQHLSDLAIGRRDRAWFQLGSLEIRVSVPQIEQRHQTAKPRNCAEA